MEIIGIFATLFIIVAFLSDDEFQIRAFDLIGALLFIVYGLTIKSFSTILLNFVLTIIQIYKLYNLRRKPNEFKN